MVQRKSTDAEERAMCEKCPHDDSHLEQLFFLRALWEEAGTGNRAWGI